MSNESKESNKDQPNLSDLITLKEAAERCELSYSHLRLLARTSKIWALKLGHNWFTTQEAVDKYLAQERI